MDHMARVGDLAAVMDAVGLERVTLFPTADSAIPRFCSPRGIRDRLISW
jgi:hypothetical protein